MQPPCHARSHARGMPRESGRAALCISNTMIGITQNGSGSGGPLQVVWARSCPTRRFIGRSAATHRLRTGSGAGSTTGAGPTSQDLARRRTLQATPLKRFKGILSPQKRSWKGVGRGRSRSPLSGALIASEGYFPQCGSIPPMHMVFNVSAARHVVCYGSGHAFVPLPARRSFAAHGEAGGSPGRAAQRNPPHTRTHTHGSERTHACVRIRSRARLCANDAWRVTRT